MGETMTSKVSLVIVSHSPQLARGVVELAQQMAPEVSFFPVGGTPEGKLGTSFDEIEAAIIAAGNVSGSEGVVILTDLGSATMTVESVIEFMEDNATVRFADGPLVEGAIAAAVSAGQGGDIDAVVEAVGQAGSIWVPAPGVDAAFGVFDPGIADSGLDKSLRAKVFIADEAGLHARPAARLARLAAQFSAEVRIDGANASSVIELMSLGKRQGDEVQVSASGSDAQSALDAITAAIASNFDK